MKIWIFNHYAVAPGAHGGTRHFDLAKELTRKGCQVTIFASSFLHQGREDTRITDSHTKVKEEIYDGVRFVWLKTGGYWKNDWKRVKNMLQYTYRAYKQAMDSEERPDLIVGSLMHPFAAWLGYLLAKKKKCLFYFEERDLWPQTLIDFGRVSAHHPAVLILSQLELFLYRKAAKIIVLFDNAHRYVEQRGINPEKVMYLPNGVDLHRFDQRPALPPEVRGNLQPFQDKFLAIYTGSHSISDHLDALLDTAGILHQRNKHIHFLFVGDGPEKERLCQRKKEEGLENVDFLPPLAKEYMPALLERADVGLVSLKNAGVYKWGLSFNKMYDYMAASLPSLWLSETPVTTIEKAKGSITAKNPNDMAAWLERLERDPERCALLGEQARDYVHQYHSWDKLSELFYTHAKEDLEKQDREWLFQERRKHAADTSSS